MAGLIRVEEKISWSAASWAFGHVIRVTLPFLSHENEGLISILKEASLEGRLDYLDLRPISVKEKSALLAAFKNGLQRTETDGAAAFSDPEFYPGFLARFNELIVMLESHLSRV